MDQVFDYRIPRLIKIRFAEFDCRLSSDKYDAEFLEGLPAPPPLYDDIECIKSGRYIKCQRKASEPFYSWFVPAKDDKMPLLVVIPGYEAQLKSYPDVSDKYNLLFISPLGYSTPNGINYDKVFNGTFRVLYNTLCGFESSYKDWLLDALTVIKFIEEKKLADTDKLIFAGTSHGGGMAMVLASYYGNEKCMAVCADLPYLIGFSTDKFFELLFEYSPPIDIRFRASDAKKRLSLVDPEWHASRLKMPVLITSSDIDDDCPEEGIENLYNNMIPETTPKAYIKYSGRPHGYSSEFFKDMMSFLGEMKEGGYL